MIEAYHGSSHQILKFSTEFVGEGHDQEGPGIYFTSDMQDAATYGRYIHKVLLEIKSSVGLKRKAKRSEIKQMILWCEDMDDKLMDWDENPKVAMETAIKSCLLQDNEHQSFLSVWYDFYRYRPVDYVQNMVKLGYDAVVVPRNTHTGVRHYIVLDPRVIFAQSIM